MNRRAVLRAAVATIAAPGALACVPMPAAELARDMTGLNAFTHGTVKVWESIEGMADDEAVARLDAAIRKHGNRTFWSWNGTEYVPA